MLKLNTSDSFPGADFVAADPVSGLECCQHQSVALIIAQLRILGKPFIMRGGRLYFDQDPGDELTMCKGPDPAVTGSDPTPYEVTSAGEVAGTNFGVDQGKVWIGNASTYEGSSVKVEQTMDQWADELIDITVVKDGLPLDPTPVWVFVENTCGRITAAGWQTSIEDPV